MTRMNHLITLALSGFLLTASVAFAVELTADDLSYLKKNKVTVDLEFLIPPQITGLHDVINDPKTNNDPKARLKSVTDYGKNASAYNFFCSINPDYPEHCKLFCSFRPTDCPTKAQAERSRKVFEELAKPPK
jgi:hypothetical protein